MRRGRLAWIAVGLALAVAAFLLRGMGATTPSDDAAGEGTHEHDPRLVRGDAEADTGTAAGTMRGAPALHTSGGPLRGPVAVRVVNEWGEPVPQQTVTLWQQDDFKVAKRSDLAGEAVFDDVPYDGSYTAGVQLHLARHAQATASTTQHLAQKVQVTGPHVRVRIKALPFEFLDDRGMRPEFWVHPSLEAPALVGGRLDLWVPMGGGEERPVVMGSAPRPAHLVWDKAPRRVSISRAAHRLTYMAPQRPEASVVVLLSPEHEWTLAATLAGRDVKTSVVHDAFGRMWLRGVPFVPGASLSVTAQAKGQKALTDSVDFSVDEKHEHVIDLRPESVAAALAELDDVTDIAWVPAGEMGYRIRIKSSATTWLSLWGRGTGTAHLVLRVRRANGAAAPDAHVTVEGRTLRTDARGRVAFPDVIGGLVDVQIVGAGAPQRMKLEIEKGQRVEHDVVVPASARIDLRVVNKDDAPLPFARVQVTYGDTMPWHDVARGVQRLDPFTDRRGRRMLHNIRPDVPATVHVDVAGNKRSATLTIGPGITKVLRMDMDAPQIHVVDGVKSAGAK